MPGEAIVLYVLVFVTQSTTYVLQQIYGRVQSHHGGLSPLFVGFVNSSKGIPLHAGQGRPSYLGSRGFNDIITKFDTSLTQSIDGAQGKHAEDREAKIASIIASPHICIHGRTCTVPLTRKGQGRST